MTFEEANEIIGSLYEEYTNIGFDESSDSGYEKEVSYLKAASSFSIIEGNHLCDSCVRMPFCKMRRIYESNNKEVARCNFYVG